MPSELRPLVSPLGLRRAPGAGGPRPYAGALGRLEIAAATAGVGIRAAASAAERILDATRPDHLVVVGIAGGIGAGVRIGDLVVPERVIDLASGAEHRPAPLGGAAPRGVLATSDRLIVDPREIAELERRGAVAIDMETAAVAAVCERRGCPWSVFRAVSDLAGDGSADGAVLGLLRPDGRPDLGALARLLATRPWRIPGLVRLARGADLASRTAAGAAVAAIARSAGSAAAELPPGPSAVV
jgi:nucleoside phosphorylase